MTGCEKTGGEILREFVWKQFLKVLMLILTDAILIEEAFLDRVEIELAILVAALVLSVAFAVFEEWRVDAVGVFLHPVPIFFEIFKFLVELILF